jgi:hypothetical protein
MNCCCCQQKNIINECTNMKEGIWWLSQGDGTPQPDSQYSYIWGRVPIWTSSWILREHHCWEYVYSVWCWRESVNAIWWNINWRKDDSTTVTCDDMWQDLHSLTYICTCSVLMSSLPFTGYLKNTNENFHKILFSCTLLTT